MAITKKFTNLTAEGKTELIGKLYVCVTSNRRCFELANELIAVGKDLGVFADPKAEQAPDVTIPEQTEVDYTQAEAIPVGEETFIPEPEIFQP